MDDLPAGADAGAAPLHRDVDLVLVPVEVVLQRLDAEQVIAGYLASDPFEGGPGARDDAIHRSTRIVGHQLQAELLKLALLR